MNTISSDTITTALGLAIANVIIAVIFVVLFFTYILVDDNILPIDPITKEKQDDRKIMILVISYFIASIVINFLVLII